jgi:hypothetical protein
MIRSAHCLYAIAAGLLLMLSACVVDIYPDGWDNEDAYWRANYANEPYYVGGYGYEEYQPAYLFGVETFHRNNGRRFEELNENELRSGWEHTHGQRSHLDWNHAREATHAAYNRMAQRSAPARSSGGSHEEQRR